MMDCNGCNGSYRFILFSLPDDESAVNSIEQSDEPLNTIAKRQNDDSDHRK